MAHTKDILRKINRINHDMERLDLELFVLDCTAIKLQTLHAQRKECELERNRLIASLKMLTPKV